MEVQILSAAPYFYLINYLSLYINGRLTGYEPVGWRFESSQRLHIFYLIELLVAVYQRKIDWLLTSRMEVRILSATPYYTAVNQSEDYPFPKRNGGGSSPLGGVENKKKPLITLVVFLF
jgi:hypothetical protein